jgi:enamine deaminase RidA (YjgF/YER057c/UK114 family)
MENMRTSIAIVIVLGILGADRAFAEKHAVLPPGAQPSRNWSHGIVVDGTLYVSGMAGEDKDGKIPATFEAEVQQALDNIGAVLKAAGMAPSDVVSVQVYLTDAALFDRMNAVYISYFKESPRPTRTTVVVAGLVGPGHIEMTSTARK